MSYKNFEDYVECHKNLFDKHIAKMTKVDTGEHDCILEFKDPETSNGVMVMTYIKGYLSFQGDYGSGSFTWYNPRNSLAWMAHTGFDYFMSKIQSGERSDGNHLMKEHDSQYCIESIKESIAESHIELPDDSWEDHTEDYYEWVSWLRENGNEYFGDGHYEWTYSAGMTYKSRAYLWKHALIKAVEHLEQQEQDFKRALIAQQIGKQQEPKQ